MFQLLHLTSTPIYQQLLLEEYLLKNSDQNWILINEGTPPAIVVGISGKVEELVDVANVPDTIPIFRRFSGGGTVIVNENTLFVTFICNKKDFAFMPYPEPILRWAHSMLTPSIPSLLLKDNDFILGNQKCGGNALYIKKERWLIHTSLLWDFDPMQMQLLKHPPKTPAYREGRDHETFLCKLKHLFLSQNHFIHKMLRSFSHQKAVLTSPPPIPSHLCFSTQLLSKNLAQNVALSNT
ncbi:MAG: lipoate--protein ligase family protein [Candidatus Rhabdochlamydia sp.]